MAKLLNCHFIITAIAGKIHLLDDEQKAIADRLFALAVKTKPGNGEYAGYLDHLVDNGIIADVFDIYGLIDRWSSNPSAASNDVMAWNNERLGQS